MAAQYVTSALDTVLLQPTNSSIVSYDIRGLDLKGPTQEFRITSKTTLAQLAAGMGAMFSGACNGLMSNACTLQQVKVRPVYTKYALRCPEARFTSIYFFRVMLTCSAPHLAALWG